MKRQKAIQARPEMLAQMMRTGFKAECYKGMPPDAIFKRAYMEKGILYLVFEHQTFDLVPDYKIPVMAAYFKNIDYDQNIKAKAKKPEAKPVFDNGKSEAGSGIAKGSSAMEKP